MFTMVNCSVCLCEVHIKDACTHIDVPSGNPNELVFATERYVCNRCSDWQHNFGFSSRNVGECSRCGAVMQKDDAVHHEVVDEDGSMNWGYFTCSGCAKQ